MAILKFKMQPQSKDQWCWAAVTSSICDFYGDQQPHKQCELANRFLAPILPPGEDCCQVDAPDDCNVPFALDLALNQMHHLVQPTRGQISFQELDQQISQNQRPVPIRIMFSDGFTAHFVVVFGCVTESSGTQMVKIADPSDGSVVSIPFLALPDAFSPGALWDQTYFTKA